MAKAPKITINIGADTRRLKGDLKKADGIVGKFSKAASGAMLGLGVAAAGAAVAIGVEGVKAAIADQKEQVTLAKTLQNTTKATDKQVAAVEDYIEKTMFATGVTDTKLRKSFDRLVRSTGSVTKAQKIQTVALDVAAGTGKDVVSVSEAIAKAYDGNYGALKRLGVPLDDSIVKTKNFDGALGALSKTFEGQADAAANTFEGRMLRLQTRMDEAKESIGAVLLEGMEPLFDFMDSPEGKKMMDDFVVVFADSMKVVAKVLPGIVKEMGKLVTNVSKGGIMAGIMGDPKLATAALAFGAGFAVGGVTGGALAAIAAYALTGDMMGSADASGKGLKKKATTGATIKIAGVSQTNADKQADIQRQYGGLTSSLTMGGAEQYQGVYKPTDNSVKIYVNALDPAAAARAVQSALNKTKRMGVSRYAGN